MDDTRIATRPRVVPSQTVRAETALGTAFVTVTTDAQPFEVFLSVGKAGSETYASAEALGRLVSFLLRIASPVPRRDRALEIVAQLDGIGSRRGPDGLPSMPEALAQVLRDLIGSSQPTEEPSHRASLPAHRREDATHLNLSAFPQDLRGKGKERRRKMSAMSVNLPPTVLAAAERLATAIEASEPVAAYRQAKARLDGDARANELLRELSDAQADLRRRQSNGGVTQEALQQVRALQREVQSNVVIMDFAMAQQAAIAYLPQVNQEISQLLGVDFASLAGPASC